MNLLATVSTIMTKNPVTISPEDNLLAAKDVFEKYQIHHIPVVFEGDLVGMLSKSDFSFFKRGFNDEADDKVLSDVKLNNYKVKSIMTKGLAKLDADDRINLALEIFKSNVFHALPVMESNKIVGIITTHDIIKHLADENIAVNEYELNDV